MTLPPPFTPAQRDLQARGKDPYPSYPQRRALEIDSATGAVASTASSVSQPTTLGELPDLDTFQFRETQSAVLAILSDYEKLSIQAAASGVSIAAKRYELEAVMCGLEQPATKGKGKGKESRKPRQSAGGEGSGSGSLRR